MSGAPDVLAGLQEQEQTDDRVTSSLSVLEGLPQAVLRALTRSHLCPASRLGLFRCSSSLRDTVLHNSASTHLTLCSPHPSLHQAINIAATAASLQLSLHKLVPFPIPELRQCLTSLHLQQVHCSVQDMLRLGLHDFPNLNTLSLHDCVFESDTSSESSSTSSSRRSSTCSNSGCSAGSSSLMPPRCLTSLTRLEVLRCWPETNFAYVLRDKLRIMPVKLRSLLCDEGIAVGCIVCAPLLTELQLLKRNRRSTTFINTDDIQELMQHPYLSVLTLPDLGMPADVRLSDQHSCSWRQLHLTGDAPWEWFQHLPLPQLEKLQIDGKLHLAKDLTTAASGLTQLQACPHVVFHPQPNWRVPSRSNPPQPVFVLHGCSDDSPEAAQHCIQVMQLVTSSLQGGLCLSHVYLSSELCSGLAGLPASVDTLCVDHCKMCPTVSWGQIARLLPTTVKYLVMRESYIDLQQALALVRAVTHELRVTLVGECHVRGWKQRLTVAAASNSNVMLRVDSMFAFT